MSKEISKRKEIVSNIINNVSKKKWTCIVDNCNETAINSHLLQQNGILDKVIEKGHLVELKKRIFEDKFIFKDTGIKEAISVHLFCNEHDTKLFKEIETKMIDFDDYRTQILFSYRATCAEIRLKEKNIEMFSRVLNSQILDIESYNPDAAENMKILIESSKLGIKDLSFYKEQFEDYLANESIKNYQFTTIKYYPLKVCASTLATPLLPEEEEDYTFIHQEKAWNSVFINIIPQTDHLYIIIGYHKNYANAWILSYIDSWRTNDKEQQQINLTEVLATRISYWGMSKSIFITISEEMRQLFIDFWEENLMEFGTELKFGFNLFAHVESV